MRYKFYKATQTYKPKIYYALIDTELNYITNTFYPDIVTLYNDFTFKKTEVPFIQRKSFWYDAKPNPEDFLTRRTISLNLLVEINTMNNFPQVYPEVFI